MILKMRNKELNLTQFETLSDEELQNRRWISADTRYARVESQSTPWWWSLKQSNFSDAYSSFYNATH